MVVMDQPTGTGSRSRHPVRLVTDESPPIVNSSRPSS